MSILRDPYLQADGRTLKNKLGINHDPKALDSAISWRSADRIAELRDGEVTVPQTFDAAHLRALHRHIFGDAFEWAGHFRSDSPTIEGEIAEPIRNMRKAGSAVSFTGSDRIEPELQRLGRGLKRGNFLKDLPRATFAKKAARTFADLNTIHPFREGNGRVQREFMSQLAQQAGHKMDFSVVSHERMYAASEHATAGDLKPMERLMDEITDPGRTEKLSTLTNFFDAQNYDWHEHYLATTSAGRKYRGTLAGVAGDDFFMKSENSIVVGNSKDLPPDAETHQEVVFTASPMGDQQMPRPKSVAKTKTSNETAPRGEDFDIS